jgi:hypothetical protein
MESPDCHGAFACGDISICEGYRQHHNAFLEGKLVVDLRAGVVVGLSLVEGLHPIENFRPSGVVIQGSARHF